MKHLSRYLLLALAAVAVLWLGHHIVQEIRYALHGTVTTGVVLAPEKDVPERSVSARPTENRVRYQFVDDDGVTHVKEIVLSDKAPRFLPGDMIRVRYLKHDPETSRDVSATRITDSEAGLMVVLLVVGVVLIGTAMWWTRSESFLAFTAWMRRRASGGWRQSRRRRQLLQQPMPTSWLQIIRQNVRAFDQLTSAEQQRLQEAVRIFVAERNWEACGGLELSDEMRVTIAGHACRLILGMQHDYFSHVPAILVYPSAFLMPADEHAALPTRDTALLGQAWYRGPVLLAWDEVMKDCQDPERGKNVVLHEFAHQLDFLGDEGNLVSGPHSREQRKHWRRVMTEEYQRLVDAVEEGRSTLLDQYGATNPAEFFAVTTECFFEQAQRMQMRHPQLYSVLRDYYGQDPAARPAQR